MLKETAEKLNTLIGKEITEDDYKNLPCSWTTVRKYMEIERTPMRKVIEVLDDLDEIASLLNEGLDCGDRDPVDYRYEVENGKIVCVRYYTKKIIKGFKK